MVRAIRLKAIVKAIFWMAFFFPKRNDVANAAIVRHVIDLNPLDRYPARRDQHRLSNLVKRDRDWQIVERSD